MWAHMSRRVSSSLTLSNLAPQGCVLSFLLYLWYTYYCVASSNSPTIVRLADDNVVVHMVSDNGEKAYLEEIKCLENWCQENNLLLNISRTKDLTVDFFMKQERSYQSLRIEGFTVIDTVPCYSHHVTCHGIVTSTPWSGRSVSIFTTLNN